MEIAQHEAHQAKLLAELNAREREWRIRSLVDPSHPAFQRMDPRWRKVELEEEARAADVTVDEWVEKMQDQRGLLDQEEAQDES